MDYIKHQESYTIVILKENKTPGYLQSSWMHDMGILNEEEWNSINAKEIVLGYNLSQFKIGDYMQFLCNQSRIQIGTNDITKIKRLVSICLGIISVDVIGKEPVSAVGVNSEFLFSFINKEDSIKFGDYFVPFKNWESFTKEPRVMEFAVTDEVASNAQTPRKSVKFSSVGFRALKDGEQLPIINANSNYHFDVKTLDDVKTVLNNAEDFFMQYRVFINDFLSKVNLEK